MTFSDLDNIHNRELMIPYSLTFGATPRVQHRLEDLSLTVQVPGSLQQL